jgi:chromosome partitioning protein
MHIITIAAQKGGVGKTTLAVNLAVAAEAAGIRTALADLDPQESATAWAERRAADAPHIEPISPRRLPAWLAAARASGFGLAIIDTPPAAESAALEAVQLSDLALIPCRPSLIDLEAIKRTAKLVIFTGKPAFVVFNCAPVAARGLLDDAGQFAKAAGLTCAPLAIRERSAFRHAWPTGAAAAEYDPAGKAAGEIAALHAFIIATLHNPMPATEGAKP